VKGLGLGWLNTMQSTLPGAMEGGSSSSIGDSACFGIVTVSDRASTGVYEDLSGPAILQFFQEAVESPWKAHYRLVPDEQPLIEQALKELVGGNMTSTSPPSLGGGYLLGSPASQQGDSQTLPQPG
jgi:hypothetical protein